VSDERVSTGVPGLDEMLEGKGYYRGSTIMLSGTAGSGKTSLASSFADATCRRGERCLYISFEESRHQVERNMKSIGLNLEPWREKGLLFYEAWRPTQYGVEMHLLRIHKLIEKINPSSVIVDPITNLMSSSTTSESEAYSMITRLMDFLKARAITTLFISLTSGGDNLEQTAVGISSMIDTWILLRDLESNGERNRCLYVLKSRGIAHSNQLREFTLGAGGIRLIPPYVGSGGVLTGSSRVAREAREKSEARLREFEMQRQQRDAEQKRVELQAQITALQAELQRVDREAGVTVRGEEDREQELEAERTSMARSRGAS
jgi:circadian clock protein KaiC